ncbi:MAG: hypothetical protein P4L56_11320 [Candidatus Sulfopaludibacter sp.]|nr:hypothetical protein [Candidatus Sulfopaludibacter sp.]
MALFTDGPPSCIEDLSAQDTQLLGIANVEGIDVTQKLNLAHDDLGVQLYSLLSASNSVDQTLWLQPRPNLAVVTVTPPLKLWHTYRTLEMFYADAYHCQLNDRYAGRRDQFHERAKWAHEKLLQIGLGIVTLPVAKAAIPIATPAAGSPLADGTYYVTMTWVNRLGEQGAAAAAVDVTTAGNTIQVQPGLSPVNATGWNVFLGTDPGALVQQNPAPLPPGQTWLQFVPPALGGGKPGQGQEPNYLRPLPRLIQRG